MLTESSCKSTHSVLSIDASIKYHYSLECWLIYFDRLFLFLVLLVRWHKYYKKQLFSCFPLLPSPIPPPPLLPSPFSFFTSPSFSPSPYPSLLPLLPLLLLPLPLLLLFPLLLNAGDWTHVLSHARHALYHWDTSPALLTFNFEIGFQ